MRRPALLAVLVVSTTLNLALAVMSFRGDQSPSAAGKPIATPRLAAARPVIGAGAWPALQPADLPAFVEQLRAAGFPPHIVRALVSAQLTQLFAARHQALDPDEFARPFWKESSDDKREMAESQLHWEQQKMLRTLLGDDAEGDGVGARRNHRRRFGDLPPEKVAPVRDIYDRYTERRMAIAKENLNAADYRARMSDLEKEQRAEIAKLLSPRELEEFDLWTSGTANLLRTRLASFDATEQEFRALYQLQRPFDERYAQQPVSSLTDEQMRHRADAQKQLTEQIKAALGPQRFAEYERATDYNYQLTSRLIARLELPASTVEQVWSVQRDIQQRAKSLRDDRTLPDEQRKAQLAELATEASRKVAATIGASGLEAYKDNGGWWIVELTVPRGAR